MPHLPRRYLDKKNPYISVLHLICCLPRIGQCSLRQKDFMIRRLIVTDSDAAVTFLRLVRGVVFFAHGDQKALGWFGGYGFSGTMGFFSITMHIPAPTGGAY